jgi:hypothetical protein
MRDILIRTAISGKPIGKMNTMKTMMAVAAFALATGVLAGCATESTTPKVASTPRQLQIISEPAGARIEINDNYVGDAPLTITHGDNDEFTYAYLIPVVIRAIPTQPGDAVQTKVLTGTEAPTRIFFNMHLVPIQ